jgi:Tfp pilus assembly protein PilN
MRELEFLPAWYHQTRRRKRIVGLEAWVLFLLVIGLGSWVALAQRNIIRDQQALNGLTKQITQTHSEQRMLAEQLSLRQQLQEREQLIASLGMPVEMTRLMQTLDSVMPKEMSLVEFNCDTDEQLRQVTSVAAARATNDTTRQMDRRLRIKLIGVAPSDVDLANFLAGLTNVPFFEQVAVTYAKDKTEAGHVLREFEVTFTMSLNQPVGAP